MTTRDFFRQWYNWYAVLTPIWVGIILFNEFICWRDWSAQDWAAWVGSIGTLLAFGGTIHLANSENRRRKRIEDGKVHLAIARIGGILEDRMAMAASIEMLLGSALKHKEYIPNCSSYAADISRTEDWTDADLEPILVLDGHVAVRMKRVQDRYRLIGRMLEMIEPITSTEQFYERYAQILIHIMGEIQTVKTEMQIVFSTFSNALPRF